MPDATARVTILYATPEDAAKAFAGIHPDDDAYASTRLDGNRVEATLRGRDARSLLRAVDDLLACLSVAEDVMNAPPMDRPNA